METRLERILGFLGMLALVVGWVINLVQLFVNSSGEEIYIRIVGVIVWPLGGLFGLVMW